MINEYTYRTVEKNDLEIISNFPKDEDELFFMFPKAEFPLTLGQLDASITSRYNSTVILHDNCIVGFANFYEVIERKYCSIGNVIINPIYRGKGAGIYLIEVMEKIAMEKYNVSEIHISCFNQNVKGLLLYQKLGYVPFEIEKWTDKKQNRIALIKMKKEINKPSAN